MIKMMTVFPNIATVLTLAILLASPGIAQEPGSILQLTAPRETSFEPQWAIPEVPGEIATEDLNVLTRGPLHEAFAAAHQPNPQSSSLVLKKPPAPIDEISPEYKPDGNNVQWISGYWAWDDAQADFIWISGIWRDVPPKRKWMPGYWNAEAGGHRWVSGFWAEEIQQEVGYLPQPPASLDQGPSIAAPSEEHFYVPGNWEFQDNTYRWLAGYWQPVEQNWIWVPSKYAWTPSGCVYLSGYWDYEFESRGTCFAPVQFRQPLNQVSNDRYRPSYAIDLNIDFMTHLFVRPQCGHYFYGDWYSSNFNNVSYRPWVSCASHLRNYDPLLSYYRCQRSSYDSRYNVVQYLSFQHNFYNNNRDYRPRPTYSAQREYTARTQLTYGSRGYTNDFIRKSSYVRTYDDLRKRDEQRRKQTAQANLRIDQQRKNATQYRKAAEAEQRNNRRQIEQLAKLQRKRQEEDRTRQAAASAQRIAKSRDSSRSSQFVKRQAPTQIRSQSQASSQVERLRRAQQDQKQRALQINVRRVQEDAVRRSKQEQSQRVLQDKARRAEQDRSRRQAAQRADQQAKQQQAQRDAVRKTQQMAQQKAQQDQDRRSRQAAADRVRQDQARQAAQQKAQQDRSRQQADQRARQQQAQRDAAPKTQQQPLQRAKSSKQRSTQQSRSSRLRSRSSKK